MLKPIEVNFKLDKTIKRALTTELMIKSHDINVIEFHISFDGLELTADHTVKVLSVFSDTGSQTNVNCEIADGKAIYRPDTSIISQFEYVQNYVYVYHGNQSLDVRLFTYSVGLSQIDKTALKVKTVYDQSYADLLADFEQALEDYKDGLPQASDLRAEVDVILNKFKTDSDAKLSQYDANAQQVIADNQTAFGLAESGRQSTYVQAEDNRNQASNQAVTDWEQDADALLEIVEGNESARVDAESTRKTAETDRVSSESTRKTNETTRISNENERESAEVIRLASEVDRVNAENVRSEFYEGFDGRLDDLSSLLGWHTAEDVVGLEVDFENSVFTRLSGAVGLNAGSDFGKLRAFGGRRRCILSDSGEVLAYYGDANYTEDGSLGQVMVEQPNFYYKVVPLKIEPIIDGKGYHLRKARYYVSDTKQVGFKLHPAFIRNGKILNNIYLSAYEGSLYDVSEGAYNLNDAQTGAFTAGTGDKLSSIANAKPASGLTQALTRSGARIVAQNRGNGWELMYAATAAATQLLFAIEYGTFNTQTAIGMGVSKTGDGATKMADPTGATSALGNASGKAENGSVTYRGEENFWMNIWKWVDGMNIKPQGLHELYVADHAFADDKGDGSYQNAGITMAKTAGYVSAFAYNESFDWLFMPSETLGNSSVPVGDYFHQNAASTAGWFAALLGGSWSGSSVNGGFAWILLNPSSIQARTIGARLVYVGGAR